MNLDSVTADDWDVTDPARWRGAIELGFAAVDHRTRLVRRRHQGPLRVQKPFYPEDGVCHLYLLHPPGGMAGQDMLHVAVTAGTGCSALVTTPAANKVYRSQGLRSEVTQVLEVAAGAGLEWLPQGTIVFGGSEYGQQTLLQAAASSRFSYWDIICLGRPAGNDDYAAGGGRQRLRVEIGGVPVYIDQFAWRAGGAELEQPWGLAQHKVFAQLLMYPADADVLQRARALRRGELAQYPADIGVTLIDGLLHVRVLGDQGMVVQAVLVALWSAARPLVMGHVACAPRIWAT